MGDRYSILGSIARGGMAQVYLARMVASAGFSRLVAVKRLHDNLSEHREFIAMLLDEARLTARIRHTNVVDILDVVVRDGAFALVLEWVEGASMSVLWKRAQQTTTPIPHPIVHAIMQGVLRGLVAAHEARAEDGQPLGIVHRDVSPQNVLVGVDGVPRIIDFGVAKGLGKLEATRPGEIRGKYAYMAPEQLMGKPVTNQVDVYAAGVMMWELLTGTRLFKADDERVVCARVLRGEIPKPSAVAGAVDVPPELDDVVMRATAREPSARYLDAREMLAALEAYPRATEEEVGAWVRSLAADTIEAHQRLIQAAPTPEAPRSLESLLEELASSRPSLDSVALDVGRASTPGPTSTPATEAAPPEATGRAAPSRRLVWLAAMGTCVLVGLVLGVAVSVATPSTRTQGAGAGGLHEPPALLSATATAASAPPTPAPTRLGAAASAEPTPSDPHAPSPGATAAPAPRTAPKPRPRVQTSVARDPTDHR